MNNDDFEYGPFEMLSDALYELGIAFLNSLEPIVKWLDSIREGLRGF